MKDKALPPIVVLSGLEAVRRRPGMYIGNGGLHELLRCLIDAAIELPPRLWPGEIRVAVAGGWASVEHDSRAPLGDVAPAHGCRKSLDETFTTLYGGGYMGYGVVNALSQRCEATLWHEGREQTLVLERGVVVRALRDEGATTKSGIRVRFLPDATSVPTAWDIAATRGHLQLLAALHPALSIDFQDERFAYRDGMAGRVGEMCRGEALQHPGPVHFAAVHESVAVDVALAWTSRGEASIEGGVNYIRADVGTHVDGLWEGLARALAIESREVARTRLGRGLVALVHVALPQARFTMVDARRLKNPEAATAVAQVTAEGLSRWLEEHPAAAADLRGRARRGGPVV